MEVTHYFSEDGSDRIELRGRVWFVFWSGIVVDEQAGYQEAQKTAWKLGQRRLRKARKKKPLNRVERLLQEEAEEHAPKPVRSSLVCPDCNAYMTLKHGKFGYFYGCMAWPTTGCRGSVSADPFGVPRGAPVNEATRRARFILVKALSHAIYEGVHTNPIQGTDENLGLWNDKQKVGEYTLEQCAIELGKLIERFPYLDEYVKTLPDHIQRSRWERLAADTEPLGVEW